MPITLNPSSMAFFLQNCSFQNDVYKWIIDALLCSSLQHLMLKLVQVTLCCLTYELFLALKKFHLNLQYIVINLLINLCIFNGNMQNNNSTIVAFE